MKSFLTVPDAMGRPTAALATSDSSQVIVLAANQAKLVTVPSGAGTVLFSATGDFWARFGAAAAVPTGDIVDGTAPELNPAGRDVRGITSIGIAAPAACVVNLVFFG